MQPTMRAAAAAVAAAAVLAWGCASAGRTTQGPAAPSVAAAPAAAAAGPASGPKVAEIESVGVFGMEPGARIDLASDSALTWTTYRDADGNLVIDLPNARPGQGVVDQLYAEGVVSELRVASAGVPSRPMTRIVIATREQAEHRLAADGNHLRIDLVPSGMEFPVAAVPQPIRVVQAPVQIAPAPGVEFVAPAPQVESEPLVAEWNPPAPAPVYAAPVDAAPVYAGTADSPLVAPPPAGLAASVLSGVELVGAATVKIAGDGDFAYSTFRLENPERFVIDLDGVLNRSDRGTMVVEEGALARVRVSQFKTQPRPVSRVVFDLTTPAIPSIDRGADGLLVRFGGRTATASSRPLESPVAPVRPLAESSSAPALAERPAPQLETSDVTAYGAPAASVEDFEAQDVQSSTFPEPGVPRVTPAVVAGQTQVGTPKEYTGEPISMSVRDSDVREVLRTFAQLSGLNIVIQPGVRGTVTVELERVPWDQALDQILKINGLGYELEGNIMRIAPLSVLESEAKRAQSIAQAQALSLPLRTVIKRLSYSKASEISSLLQRGAGGIMSQRGSVIVDGRTNTLIIKEIPTYIDTVLAVIETLDVAEPQVMIEARIVETTKQFSRSLGIRWGFEGIADQAHGNTTGLQFPYTADGQGGVNLLTGGANGFIDLALGNVLDTFTLNARLQAAEAEGLINVLSAPKIATLNNNRASIQSGVQIPVQTVANNTVSVQFVNATLRLNVTPHVTAEGTVMLDIDLQKREPQFAFQVAGAPSAPIATKDARTRVIVRDGGTTVIGGIYKVTTDQGQDRVPGLANMPILGNLFKNRRSRSDNDELLIFITPRVIKL